MQGNAEMLCRYMEGSTKRFIIPVYQRNYDWKIEQCKRLFDDLIKLQDKKRKTHFFGSIVSAKDDDLDMQEFLIIDGQQRLTTVSLMLLALHDILMEGKLIAKDTRLAEKLRDEFLVDKYVADASRIKLKSVKADAAAFKALIDEAGEHVRNSNITINYNYFYDRILKGEISPDDLYKSFCKLQIISIFLQSDDNPQLIFESLNSTGLDLSEGDKIRNYILMGLKPTSLQEKYYEKYWNKIEKCTDYNVSAFVRDYLSIKMQATPTMKKVYLNFKDFMDTDPFNESQGTSDKNSRKELMEDLLSYARRYEILIKANGKSKELNSLIDRLNRFEATVTRPFLMEAIKQSESGNIKQDELLEVFEVVESYIFRRLMCDIPTNALNNIFVALNTEITRYDGTNENYLEKLKYALLRKTTSGIFPDDNMFAEGLSNKQVYLMSSKNKKYIMERFENGRTKEVKDVWGLIDEGTYTIEHIMPQTLHTEWRDDLGEDHALIHEEWLHKLANLTLTAYNSRYSNSSFDKKLKMQNGFIDSGLRMNQHIAKQTKWSLTELEERNKNLVAQGLKIWPMVETTYQPLEKVLDTFNLADDVSMKGRRVSKFSFLGIEQSVSSWVDAYTEILAILHSKDPMVLLELAAGKQINGLNNCVEENPNDKNSYYKLEEGIYLSINTNTETKLSMLRKLFELYKIEEEELMFYLRDNDLEELEDLSPSRKMRIKFWTIALPLLNKKTGKFENISPSISNWQSTFIGHSSVNINVIANLKELRVELYIGKKDKQINDDIFSFIKEDQEVIEKKSNRDFVWISEPENITSRISLEYPGIGIAETDNWEECIELLADGVNIILEYLIPKVDAYFE